jgi:hypothetical protein
MSNLDDVFDPSLGARKVAQHEGRSIVAINRDIRRGRFPAADYTIGAYRFWKLSTLVRWRERRIAESAHQTAVQRQAQLDSAAHARAEQKRKRTTTAAANSDAT